MNTLDQFDRVLLDDFIGQHWAQFVEFCEQHDMDEAACEELAKRLLPS